MKAGLTRDLSSNWEMARAMLAVTIEELMLVPEACVHWSWALVPERAWTFVPKVRRSGLMMPFPSRRDQVVMPRELKEATFWAVLSRLPTPTTLIRSAGLLSVPMNGPSLPMADTTVTPRRVSWSILLMKGRSRKSLLPLERFTTSMSCSSTKLKASRNHDVCDLWSPVNTLKMYISASGAIPGQS